MQSLMPLPFSDPAFPGTRTFPRADPLFHFAFFHDPLRDDVPKYANWVLSWNTRRKYNSGEKRLSFPHEQTYNVNRRHSPRLRGDSSLLHFPLSSYSASQHNKNLPSSRPQSLSQFQLRSMTP